MSEYQTLVWEQGHNIATVTLNRPEKKNAMSWQMFEEIGSAFRRAGDSDEVRCLVVTGAGDAFCSGADLTDERNIVGSAFELKD